MPTVLEVLKAGRHLIECNACGNCCKGTQPSHLCRFQAEDGKCTIHPALLGHDIRKEKNPECNTTADPLQALLAGYACYPVMEVIKNLTGEELRVTNVIPADGLPFRGNGPYYVDYRQLKKVLLQNIVLR